MLSVCYVFCAAFNVICINMLVPRLCVILNAYGIEESVSFCRFWLCHFFFLSGS